MYVQRFLLNATSIKKLCEQTAVPALEATHFIAGTPPARQFRLLETAPQTVQ